MKTKPGEQLFPKISDFTRRVPAPLITPKPNKKSDLYPGKEVPEPNNIEDKEKDKNARKRRRSRVERREGKRLKISKSSECTI